MASGVEFEEDKFSYKPRPQAGMGASVPGNYQYANSGYGSPNMPGLAGWLIRHHIAKTPAAAQYVMVGIIIVNIIIMFVVFKFVL